jgi:hypothetical protein
MNKVKLEYCPDCKQKSLFWNQTRGLWECLNKECPAGIYTPREFSEYSYNKQQKDQPVRQSQPAQRGTHTIVAAPLWLVNILESKRFWKLLICSAVIWWCWTAIQYSGNSIGLAFGLAIPILLLYAIKVILRKFLSNYRALASQHYLSQVFYSIRKSSFLRFAIIFATVALLVTTIWSMVSLIYRLTQNASLIYLFNMLVIIIAQIWLLSWLCGMLKHSRQLSSKPKFAVVFWSLFGLVVFCAFVGIHPFSDIKDTAKTALAVWWEQSPTVSTTPTNTTPSPPPTALPTTTPEPTTSSLPKLSTIPSPSYFISHVSPSGRVELIDNPKAKDPTYGQLVAFLEMDRTDKRLYSLGTFTCGDYAEILHNNAEKAGWRAAFVVLQIREPQEVGNMPWYSPYQQAKEDSTDNIVQHACNAFNTTDLGLVFIDNTGADEFIPGKADKKVKVEIGEDYCPVGIFSRTATYYKCMGTVVDYIIYWSE